MVYMKGEQGLTQMFPMCQMPDEEYQTLSWLGALRAIELLTIIDKHKVFKNHSCLDKIRMAFYNTKQTMRTELKVCSCLDKIRTEHL